MKKIFLIEDEWVHAEDIRILVEEMEYEWLGYTHEGVDALQKIEDLKPDVILIDLNLNGLLAGITIAKKIKAQTSTPFIFTTSYLDDETIQQCLAVNPIAYLHKPVNKIDLKAALLKAQQVTAEIIYSDVTQQNEQQIMIRVGNTLKPVLTADITVVQTDAKNYICIHTKQHQQFAIKQSLTAFENQLPANIFIRVHKEYLINLKSIISINEPEQTILVSNLHVPLGKHYKAGFLARFTIL